MFKGNYAKADGEKDDNAIYVGNAEANLNLQQLNNGNMYMFDNIRGEDGYKVNISGDSTGTYYMFNDIYNGNVTMANTTVNTVNNEIYVYDFKSLTVNGNTDFVADVDMANQTMDRFTASTYGNHKGKLNVKDMNFVSGSDKDKIEIYFAQKGLKDYVTTSKKEFLTPLYKYGIHYDNREDAGYFDSKYIWVIVVSIIAVFLIIISIIYCRNNNNSKNEKESKTDELTNDLIVV